MTSNPILEIQSPWLSSNKLPTLFLGHTYKYSYSPRKEFIAMNKSEFPLNVTWSCGFSKQFNGPVKLSLFATKSENGTFVKSRLSLSKQPFEIIEESAIIEPNSSKLFTILLSSTDDIGIIESNITGIVKYTNLADDLPSNCHPIVSFRAHCIVEYPQLEINENKFQFNTKSYSNKPEFAVKFKTTSHSIHTDEKVINLRNPGHTKLTFNVRLKGPFELCLESQSLTILPNDATSFVIKFHSTRMVNIDEMQLDGILELSLPEPQSQKTISIPLRVHTVFPHLSTSIINNNIIFNTCLVGQEKTIEMFILNHTEALANWKITHSPMQSSVSIVESRENNCCSIVDDPAVFHLTPEEGILDGPCISVDSALTFTEMDSIRNTQIRRIRQPSWSDSTVTIRDILQQVRATKEKSGTQLKYPMAVTIKFAPKADRIYKSKYIISCESGNTIELECSGSASYDGKYSQYSPFC